MRTAYRTEGEKTYFILYDLKEDLLSPVKQANITIILPAKARGSGFPRRLYSRRE